MGAVEFVAFGELLWDVFPSGRHIGGAPFNVVAHLAELGVTTALLSAVGCDEAGDALVESATARNVVLRFVGRAREGLPTGTVRVTLDAQANASYEVAEPVAWDAIHASEEALEGVRQSQAFIFGSLAARSPHNRRELDRLLQLDGPLRLFDVNLRPPHADLGAVLELCRRADVIKLNQEELGQLLAWLDASEAVAIADAEAVCVGCAALASATGVGHICVTRGAHGAASWLGGDFVTAASPAITVRDTVGAGDAFMAAFAYCLTRGVSRRQALARACGLGAFVASHVGATPSLPLEVVEMVVYGARVFDA